MRVEVIPVEFEKGIGYDLKINSEFAVVQDYLDALNETIENKGLARLWNSEVKTCYGCDLCCAERIPLTLIDIYRLLDSRYVKENIAAPDTKAVGTAGCYPDFMVERIIKRFVYVYAEQSGVDMSLRLDDSGCCPFLEQGTCTVYHFRPLVCQTFICSPLTKRASEFRREIVNVGENELVRWWLKLCIEKEESSVFFDEADEPVVKLDDWKENAFTGKHFYSHLSIKKIVSGELWEKLVN